ncbi:MAG TPA: class I SAM-dependent methyltransferase [Pyrinomonadaceae bacterium]|jgi:SAM-dependent methyltransferase
MVSSLKDWERAERERSAQEASQEDFSDLTSDPKDIARYLNPPSTTIHSLEFAFHLLGDIRGKTVLEYGCGDGINTILLANRGARVIALDISPDLIGVARRRLETNGFSTDVDFIAGSAHDVPLESESIDIVFGIAILHHLDLQLSSREVYRLLKKGGIAIFQEPVRNSKTLKAIRKLIPYKAPNVSPYERPLTDQELTDFAGDFSSYSAKAFELPTSSLVYNMLSLPRNITETLRRCDATILKNFSLLRYYSPVRVIHMRK